MLREADRGKISLVGFVVYQNFEVRQKSIFDRLLKGWYVNTNKIFSVLLVTPLASWMESRTLARETRCRLR